MIIIKRKKQSSPTHNNLVSGHYSDSNKNTEDNGKWKTQLLYSSKMLLDETWLCFSKESWC